MRPIFRPEIEGLRAIAVLSVVMYHAKFPLGENYALSGGFLGVDIFFVISGFLITRILLEDLANGRYSISTFYLRRARRLLPALFLVVVVCIPVAETVLDTSALQEFGASIMASLFFVSNLYFFFQDSYAAEPSLLKPLLHTWSLAIEEQFYLFFPLVLFALFRRRRPISTFLLIIAGLSFAWAVLQSGRNSDAAFFLIFSRAWELLVGALVAASPETVKAARRLWFGRFMPSVGLGAILLSLILMDLSMQHPSWPTLVPVLGTAFILVWAGTSDRDPVIALLSAKPMRFFGLISYSLYLWHVPFMAFTRVEGNGYVAPVGMVGLILASTAIASLSWWLVERPFRQRDRFSDKTVIAGLGGVACALSIYGGVVVATKGWDPYRVLTPQLIASAANWADPGQGNEECFDTASSLEPGGWCTLGVPTATEAAIILIGDSHAMALAPSVEAVLKDQGKWGFVVTRSGCPVVPNFVPSRGEPLESECDLLAQRVVAWIADQPAGQRPQIILSSRWNYYVCGDPVPDCGYTQETLVDGVWSRNRPERLSNLDQALRGFGQIAKDLGVQSYIVAQVPHQPMDALDLYATAHADQASALEDNLNRFSRRLADHLEFTGETTKTLSRVSADLDLLLVDPAEVLCGPEGICPVGQPEMSFYSDDDHVSVAAVQVLAPWIESWLRKRE